MARMRCFSKVVGSGKGEGIEAARLGVDGVVAYTEPATGAQRPSRRETGTTRTPRIKASSEAIATSLLSGRIEASRNWKARCFVGLDRGDVAAQDRERRPQARAGLSENPPVRRDRLSRHCRCFLTSRSGLTVRQEMLVDFRESLPHLVDVQAEQIDDHAPCVAAPSGRGRCGTREYARPGRVVSRAQDAPPLAASR